MKKLLAVVLALVLVFSFAACNKDKGGQTGDFEKPENYASVILVSINPQFRLYLDVAGEVLAVEPVNDDAKSIAENITVTKGSIEEVIDKIVVATNDGGFVKDAEATVNLEVVEVKNDKIDTTKVLKKVEQSANDSFEKIEITVNVVINVTEKDESEAPEESSSEEPSSESSSSEDASSEEVHKHSFAAATCVSPKVCACGATEGAALGHNFANGTCARCGAKDPNYRTPLAQKGGSWKGIFWVYVSGEEKRFYEMSVNIAGNVIGYGGGGTALDITGSEEGKQEAINNGEAFQFDGEWWMAGFGGGMAFIQSITENGNAVTMVTDEGTATFTRTGENTLQCTSSTPGLICEQGIKVGTVFTCK